MTELAASVVIRAHDRARELPVAIASVRAQTVACEVIVVDSGSSDGSLALAGDLADRVVALPGPFSYGRALNEGARGALAPIHVALSAHCRLPRRDWVESARRLYERRDVAAAGGMLELPDRTPAVEGRPFFQRLENALAHPFWGLSNHAASWRAEAWRSAPFDELIDYAEDKEWAVRVMRAGWTIAFERSLWVDMSHQWRQGMRQQFHRERRGALAVGSFVELPPYGVRGVARDWWLDLPDRRHRASAHRFLNVRRSVALAGRYVGRRALERAREADHQPPPVSSRSA
jgi:glycosyltransferase involved in cell wall biosynthesis